LSQWSYDESSADSLPSLEKVTVPVLVLANEADHLVPLSHSTSMYNALKSTKNKTFRLIKNASHYYFFQEDILVEVVEYIIDWTRKHGMLETTFVNPDSI